MTQYEISKDLVAAFRSHHEKHATSSCELHYLLLTFKWAAGVLNIQVIYILDLHALFCAIYLDDANLVGDSEHFL
jgi:hypothetical protein